jgi:hypothetical protein
VEEQRGGALFSTAGSTCPDDIDDVKAKCGEDVNVGDGKRLGGMAISSIKSTNSAEGSTSCRG